MGRLNGPFAFNGGKCLCPCHPRRLINVSKPHYFGRYMYAFLIRFARLKVQMTCCGWYTCILKVIFNLSPTQNITKWNVRPGIGLTDLQRDSLIVSSLMSKLPWNVTLAPYNLDFWYEVVMAIQPGVHFSRWRRRHLGFRKTVTKS